MFFSNIVQGALSDSNYQISDNQWVQGAPDEDIDTLWERMKILVDDLNTGRYGQMTRLSMPAKFGYISKAYVAQDYLVANDTDKQNFINNNPLSLSVYILSKDIIGNS